MDHLVSFLFFVEFSLVFICFLYNLFSVGFSFKLGITFGLLFFIFLPILVMIITGKISLSISGFGNTGSTAVSYTHLTLPTKRIV